MFFQDTTPDTSVYMIAGYTIFFVLIILYLISLMIRTRNLNRDLATLESMKVESPTTVGGPSALKSSGNSHRAVKKKTKGPKAKKSNQIKKKVTKKK